MYQYRNAITDPPIQYDPVLIWHGSGWWKGCLWNKKEWMTSEVGSMMIKPISQMPIYIHLPDDPPRSLIDSCILKV